MNNIVKNTLLLTAGILFFSSNLNAMHMDERKAPAKAATVAEDKKAEDKAEEKDECRICMSPIINDKRTLGCDHYYHQKCIMKWLMQAKNNQCPYCKKPDSIIGAEVETALAVVPADQVAEQIAEDEADQQALQEVIDRQAEEEAEEKRAEWARQTEAFYKHLAEHEVRREAGLKQEKERNRIMTPFLCCFAYIYYLMLNQIFDKSHQS